jgi:hypothetical protein
MKQMTLFLFILLPLFSTLIAQKHIHKETEVIIKEGKRLYRAEMAAWSGTDLFIEAYKNTNNIGGYFSYTEQDISKCIFFSKAETPKVIGTISFDSTYNTSTAKVNLEERTFSSLEQDLYEIRKKTLEAVQSDTLFKTYQNTSLNIIPLIHNKKKKVYILTGPQVSGVVIFGNDYLITFNSKNEIISKKQLHQNIIPIQHGSEEGETVIGSMHSHSHETGDYITATDVCTLMLYEKYTPWETHNVVSKKYLNIWNCKTNSLMVIPMDVVKKIDKDQDKKARKSKKKAKSKKK